MEEFATHYNLAKEAGLGVTLHIAEVCILQLNLRRFTTPNAFLLLDEGEPGRGYP